MREVMTEAPTVVKADESVKRVAEVLAEEQVGSVIVCNDEDRLDGIITDRDIAIQVVAGGLDAETTSAGQLLDDTGVVTIGADSSLEDALDTMKQRAVRRLPVIDGHELIGIVSQADLARHAGNSSVGEMVEGISSLPDNTARG